MFGGWGEYFPVSTEQGMRTSESNFRGVTRHTGAVIHRPAIWLFLIKY